MGGTEAMWKVQRSVWDWYGYYCAGRAFYERQNLMSYGLVTLLSMFSILWLCHKSTIFRPCRSNWIAYRQMTKSSLFFLDSGNYLENSRSGKSYLFFCPEAECKISQHSCFWSKLLEMQRLLADPRMSESYLDLFQGCVQFGTDIYCEVFVRESMEIYTSVLQSLDSVEISHYHKEQPRPTTAIADNKYFL